MIDYRLTLVYEAPDDGQAIKLAQDAAEQVTYLHIGLEKKSPMEDESKWEEVETEEL